MTIFVKKEILHQIIDDLPENQLLELAKFVEFLLSEGQQGASNFGLWDLTEEDSLDAPQHMSAGDDLSDLNEVIQAIKNTPPNDQAITLPTKTWTEYAAEITLEADDTLDVEAWNKSWDVIEEEMETDSLAHEEIERREQGG